MEQNSHATMDSQSLKQWGTFASFWLHTMSLLFFRTTNVTLNGATHPES